jgi:hypothetical protein
MDELDVKENVPAVGAARYANHDELTPKFESHCPTMELLTRVKPCPF